MPILAPLSDFAGVDRALTVTAYQSASGWINLITPTSAVIMGGLTLAKVGYDQYIQFVAPYLALMFVLSPSFVAMGATLSRRAAELGVKSRRRPRRQRPPAAGRGDDHREPARKRARRLRRARPGGDEHELALSHGNGPQVGLLALQGVARTRRAALPARRPRRRDAGHDRLPDRAGARQPAAASSGPVATLLTMVEVDPDDPGVRRTPPSRSVRSTTGEAADALAAELGWTFKLDGDAYRRVVPSPDAEAHLRAAPDRWLLEQGCVVICGGGGGIPTVYEARTAARRRRGRHRQGPRQRAARERPRSADVFVMATDVDAVYLDWGKPTARAIGSRPSRRAHGARGSVRGGLDAAQGHGRLRVRPRPRAGRPRIGRLVRHRRDAARQSAGTIVSARHRRHRVLPLTVAEGRDQRRTDRCHSESIRRSASCARSWSTGRVSSTRASRRRTPPTCCSTTSSGSSGPRRSTTRSPSRCVSAASRSSTPRSCSPRR